LSQELVLKLMQTGQSDWLSWILFLVVITVMQFYASKLQAQLWINEIRKALSKLEEYMNDATNKFVEEASKYGRSEEEVRSLFQRIKGFFIIEPVTLDPFGAVKRLEHLIENSRDVDVLIHEAQANHMINLIRDFNIQMGANLAAKVMEDIITYHTTPVQAAEIANLANVKHLIFYHLTPAPRNRITEIIFLRGVDEVREEWTLSRDGTMVVLPVESDEIILSELK